MKCNFCGREVPKGSEECPYCHYRFEQEATILNPRERDEFEGVTIDESGYEENAVGNNGTRSPEYMQPPLLLRWKSLPRRPETGGFPLGR